MLSTLQTYQVQECLDGTVDKGKAMHTEGAVVAVIMASQAGNQATQVSPRLQKLDSVKSLKDISSTTVGMVQPIL